MKNINMNTDTTMMTKSDMPNFRIELRDDGIVCAIDKKFNHKSFTITLPCSLPNIPLLVGFEIKPIFSKVKK